MKLRLHEIELGVQSPARSQTFYGSVLGLDNVLDEAQLKVFRPGMPGLDFNVSTHLPAGAVVTSFLTDDLPAVIERLNAAGIPFEGPKASHLGMQTIEFTDPDGHRVRINQPGHDSPSWLVP